MVLASDEQVSAGTAPAKGRAVMSSHIERSSMGCSLDWLEFEKSESFTEEWIRRRGLLDAKLRERNRSPAEITPSSGELRAN